MVLNMVYIGGKCRQYRKRVLKTDLREVANSVGYSRENVSAFESGRNANSLILLWYLSKGMTFEQLTGGEPVE